jgi:predicted GNAT superfamily acetyltransferase
MDRTTKVFRSRDKKFLLKVETSHNPQDYLKYEKLRNEIWGDPSDSLAGSRNMLAENYYDLGSALYLALYVGDKTGKFIEDWDHFIGFSYGFVGVDDKKKGFGSPGNLRFYSQYTAVRDEYRKFGLGIELKKFQRDVLLDIFGITTVTCTFDPLTGVNAFRNIHFFGMEVEEYKEAHYEGFTGYLNRLDIPCDRFFLSWDLNKKAKRADFDIPGLVKKGSLVFDSVRKKISGKNGPLETEIVEEIHLDRDHDTLLLEIPFDFYRMLRETDVPDKKIRQIPLDWRLASRRAFVDLFSRGYRVRDFCCLKTGENPRDFYVLSR